MELAKLMLEEGQNTTSDIDGAKYPLLHTVDQLGLDIQKQLGLARAPPRAKPHMPEIAGRIDSIIF